jgi:hypothetical protein
MGYELSIHNATRPLRFFLRLAADHVTGATGKVPVVTLAKTGGVFGPVAGAVTEVGVGWYAVAPNTTDASVLGPLTLHATAAACDPCDDTFTVVDYDPDAFTVNNPSTVTPDAMTLRDVIRDALLELGVLGITDPGESGLAEVGQRWRTSPDEWNANHDASWAQTFPLFILLAGASPVTMV